MPAELVGLITSDHYGFLMGFAGVCAASVIFLIWSRGL